MKTAYFEGRPPKSVNMYWRRFALSAIPIDDPVAFEVWLRARWMEKDALIEAYYRHGRFPADRGAHKTREGVIIRGVGHVETEIKSNYWYEFLQIFAPIGVLALVLYTFYNALPSTYVKALSKQNEPKKLNDVPRTQVNLQKQPFLTQPTTSVSTNQKALLANAMNVYSNVSKHAAVRKVIELPELSSKGLRAELVKHGPAIDTILTQKNAVQDIKVKLPAPRTVVPPSQGSNQSIKQSNRSATHGSLAKVFQPKVGERKAGAPAKVSPLKQTMPGKSPTKPTSVLESQSKPKVASHIVKSTKGLSAK